MRYFLALIITISLLTSCATKRTPVLSNPNYNKGTNTSSTTTNNTSTRTDQTGKPSVSGLSYIDQYKDVAIREMNKYGIPASIKLAQALLESGNGNSYLATQANNHFGIKCGGVWNGPSVRRDDDAANECFRSYTDPEESFKDHSQFLLRKRYEKLFLLDKDDYKGWAKGLKEAGYATNPRYPELLISLIERYELYKYDRSETVVEKVKREEQVENIIETKVEAAVPVKAEQIKAPVAMVIHEVKASQTLYSISKLYSVSVDQIKQLNNLITDNLSIGQLLVVSK